MSITPLSMTWLLHHASNLTSKTLPLSSTKPPSLTWLKIELPPSLISPYEVMIHISIFLPASPFGNIILFPQFLP